MFGPKFIELGLFRTGMRRNGIDLRPYKLRGECTELRFMTRALEVGLHVTKPWGDSASYDVIVELEGRFMRVQVKSTSCKLDGWYTCQLHHSHSRRYEPNSFDFVAFYVIPEDLWYIIPEEDIRGQGCLYVRMGRRSKFNRYKEAWDLLQQPAGEIVDMIHACVEGETGFAIPL